MKNVILFASVSLASGLLLTNVYTSLIDAKVWGSDIPNSIVAAREYFKTVNPGNFFRMFSPVNQVLALLLVILFWKFSPSVRWCLSAALLLYILTDVFTFAYFYPRNEIMFVKTPMADIATLKRVCAEWNMMNWVRSLILFAGLFFSFLSLHKIYSSH